jgi:hypothetical protein
VPAVIAGFAVSHLGLATTFETFGSVVAGIALLGAAEAWRTRPDPPGSSRTPGHPAAESGALVTMP